MSTTTVPEILKLGALLIAETASPLPLEHTQVNAHLNGLVASVTVRQRFSNPQTEPVELEYLFPLPQDAALVNFQILIGQRVVRGELRERQQAEQAYVQAQSEGKHAALLEQKRPNLFTIRIANVLPGEVIETNLEYEDRLLLRPGEMEFVFPMGLTPRYHSPLHPTPPEQVNPVYTQRTDQIGSVAIEVTAVPGFATAAPTSPSHALKLDHPAGGGFSLTLDGPAIPDHDFVLRIPLSGAPVEIFARCGKDASGSTALIDWLPGDSSALEPTLAPREFVFVLDRSGSMSGAPIQQARNALRACLRILEPHDTFRILLFDDRLEWYKPKATQVSQAAIHQADQYLDTVSDRGGTEIILALEAALGLPSDAERVRYILFLTDGAVSAEEQALAALRQQLGRARIFTFGIGSSVNRALLSKMAQWGRGTAEFLQIDEDIEGAILRFQDKVAFPMLTDITLEWLNCQAWDVYPPLLPDLYAGQPLQLSARLKPSAQAPAQLRITGQRGSTAVRMELTLPEPDGDFPEAARLWARARIADLLDQPSGAVPGHQVRQEIIGLALEHHLITPYTAFVAVDQEVVNKKGKTTLLQVSHPQPKGLADDLFDLAMPAVSFAPPSPTAMPPIRNATMAFMSMDDEDTAAGYIEEAAPQPKKALGRMAKRLQALVQPAPASPPAGAGIRESQVFATGSAPAAFDPEAVLRGLARTQELDGSWSGGVEFTAAALLAFLRSGHTLRDGYYRKQVRRAAEWLLKLPAGGPGSAAQALALTEMGQQDPQPQWQQAAGELAAQLSGSSSAFDQLVAGLILQTLPMPPASSMPTNLEELRLAAALRQPPAQAPAWLNHTSDPLAQVWGAALLGKS